MSRFSGKKRRCSAKLNCTKPAVRFWRNARTGMAWFLCKNHLNRGHCPEHWPESDEWVALSPDELKIFDIQES